MTAPTSDTCPRCNQPFACRPDAIHECACTQVTLSPAVQSAIRAYTEQAFGRYCCLCVNCLRELQDSLQAQS